MEEGIILLETFRAKKIGFTGTRNGMNKSQFFTLQSYFMNTGAEVFHHGDCFGADEQAHKCVREIGNTKVHIHPPLDFSLRAFCHGDITEKPKEYLDRNKDIVDSCDLLIATPEGKEKHRSGTWSTIRYAARKNKPTLIINPEDEIDLYFFGYPVKIYGGYCHTVPLNLYSGNEFREMLVDYRKGCNET